VTKLEIGTGSVFELEVGDQVGLGGIEYSVQGFARGGMGFILFLEKTNSFHCSKISVHGSRLAIKSVLGSSTPDLDKLFLRELTVWSGFDHFNIINLNEIVEVDNALAAAMDWCSGSLRDYIRSNGNLSIALAVHVIKSVIDALSYASKNYSACHLDLKPENILFDKRYIPSGRFMVSDWGISSIRGELAKNSNLVDQKWGNIGETLNNIGTIPYMAPERFHKGFNSSSASDIFSVGIMFFELMSGKLPFDSNQDIAAQISNSSYIDRIDKGLENLKVEKRASCLIRAMVTPDLGRRINDYDEIKSILNHLIKSKYSFTNLFNRM
jgi:serine/threonine protein kinase